MLLDTSQDKYPFDVSADGRFLLYQSIDPQTKRDIWVLPLVGDPKPLPFLKTNFDERWAQFSPDGSWVASNSNESGRYEIYVRAFPGPGPQWHISSVGGLYPRWRRDGRELYYIAPDAKIMAVPIASRGATVEPGAPVPLFQTRASGTDPENGPPYDVARDGRFLILGPVNDVVSPITVIQNWRPPVE